MANLCIKSNFDFFSLLEELKKKHEEEMREAKEKLQVEALKKQKDRNQVVGELLRSKGFLWLASTSDLIGAWQQAGNVLRIRAEGQWMCLTPQFWEGTPAEELVRKVRMNLLRNTPSDIFERRS